MRCKKCGQALSRGQTVCPSCGNALDGQLRRARNTRRFIGVTVTIIVLIAGLLVLNFYMRGELNSFSLDSVRGLFVSGREAAPTEPAKTPVPIELPEPTGTPAAEETPEPVETAEPTASPEGSENADLTGLSVEIGTPAPSEEPEPMKSTPSESEAGNEAQADPTEAWRAVESERLHSLLSAWSACAAAQPDALDRLLTGDLRLLLGLGLSDLAGSGNEPTSVRLVSGFAHEQNLSALCPFWPAVEDIPGSWALSSSLFYRALPEGEALDALLQRYLNLALQSVEGVQRGSGMLEAEGLLQNCETLTVTLDGETVKCILQALIGELRWDEELHSCILEAAGDLGEAGYDSFLVSVNRLDYALSRASLDGTLRVTDYVGADGRFCGRELLWSGEKPWRISFAAPVNGARCGLSLSGGFDELLLDLSGRGSLDGEALSGSFLLRRDADTLGKYEIP